MLDPANDFRLLQETETQENRIISEGLFSQFRKNLEEAAMFTRRTGITGTTTSTPTNTLLTDTGAAFVSGGMIGLRVVVTSGTASGYSALITGNTATTITCSAGNFLASGMASGDDFAILYVYGGIKGHTHNGRDSVSLGAPARIHSLYNGGGVTAQGTSIATSWGTWDSNTLIYVKRPGINKIFASALGSCSDIDLSINIELDSSGSGTYLQFHFSDGFASTSVMDSTSADAADVSSYTDYYMRKFTKIYLGDANGVSGGTVYGLDLYTA
jgi:hypothetical protein